MPRSCSRRSAPLAANFYRLPSSRVRTAVHVQHLPGYVTSFRQINDSFSNVLGLGDRAHRCKSLHEVLRIVFMQRSIDSARRDRVETDIVLRVFA